MLHRRASIYHLLEVKTAIPSHRHRFWTLNMFNFAKVMQILSH